MIDYELAQILHVLNPIVPIVVGVIAGTIAGAVCIGIGIIVTNGFWKARIHRYAKTEIVETLEYQKNKIESLEIEIQQKNTTISDYKGIIKISNTAALKIIGVTK